MQSLGRRRQALVAAMVFLVFVVVAFFADGVRLRLEAKDPNSLPPVATGIPRLGTRVVLVVLDSVPVRVATDPEIMPHLVALAKSGASGVGIAPPETTTPAGVRALSIGTKPSLRDTLEMFSHEPFAGWSIFDELVARGEPVGFYGDSTWMNLLGNRAQGQESLAHSESFFADDAASMAAAVQRLRSGDRAALVVLHVSSTDFVAHQFGTQRREYRERLGAVDADLRRFIESVADPGTTFIVTADHGCDLFGGHGGSADIYRRVPVVLSGAGILPVHDFEIESRQMPLAMAALLGTRLPGGILAPAPSRFLALDDAGRSRLAAADLRRIQALAAFHHVAASDDIPAMLAAIDQSSRPDPGMLVWIAVIFLAMAIVYLASLVQVRGQTLAFTVACALLAVLIATPSIRLSILTGVASIEIVLLAVALQDLPARQRASARAALAGAAVVMIVAAIRFARGGAFLVAMAKPLALGAAVAVPIAIWAAGKRLRALATPWTVAPLAIFAGGVLKPVYLVPLLICGVLALALRASKVAWMRVGCALGAAMAFFLLAQRLAFAWTGERVWARYAFAFAAGGVLIALCAWKLRQVRSWLLPSLVCLVALWPFGFVTFGYAPLSNAAQGGLVALVFAAAMGLAFRLRIAAACALPLCSALAYHAFPGPASFYLALAAHLVTFAVIAAWSGEARLKHLATAGVAFSLLFLMSPPLDAVSVLLYCAVLPLAWGAPTAELDDSTLVVLGAFLLTFVRYGLVDSFGHTGALVYELSNVDTHSGFGAMSQDVQLWVPTTLVILKMVAASVLVFALFFVNRRLRPLAGQVMLVCLAIAAGLLVQSSVEVALSFGANEARLSDAMMQVVFHAAMVVLLVAGHTVYELLVGNSTDRREPRRAPRVVQLPFLTWLADVGAAVSPFSGTPAPSARARET